MYRLFLHCSSYASHVGLFILLITQILSTHLFISPPHLIIFCYIKNKNPANFTLEPLYPRYFTKLILHNSLGFSSHNYLSISHTRLRLSKYFLLKPHTLNTSSHLYPMN
jgi:hypothetical protein